MITEILLVILFLFYFQIDKISEYFFQFRHLSSEIIINCFNTSKYIDLIRILTFNLFHIDINHLLGNCITFIGFGAPLERVLNRISYFLYFKIIFTLSILSGVFYVLFNYLIYCMTGDVIHYNQLTCGFSGVLFGLQFIFYYLSFNDYYEAFKRTLIYLLYIKIFVANSSFIGHLAGLTSGYVVSRLYLN